MLQLHVDVELLQELDSSSAPTHTHNLTHSHTFLYMYV